MFNHPWIDTVTEIEALYTEKQKSQFVFIKYLKHWKVFEVKGPQIGKF